MKYTKDEFTRLEARTMTKLANELGNLLSGSDGVAIMLIITKAYRMLFESLFGDFEEVEIVSDKEQ